MKTLLFSIIGFGAGAAITFQSSMSGQLSKRVGSPLVASSTVFLVGFVVLSTFIALSKQGLPGSDVFKSTPKHLWVIGGMISACALTSVYWLMPKAGVSVTMLSVLTGQLIALAIIGHCAWFGFAATPLTFQRIFALSLVLLGACLFNMKSIKF